MEKSEKNQFDHSEDNLLDACGLDLQVLAKKLLPAIKVGMETSCNSNVVEKLSQDLNNVELAFLAHLGLENFTQVLAEDLLSLPKEWSESAEIKDESESADIKDFS